MVRECVLDATVADIPGLDLPVAEIDLVNVSGHADRLMVADADAVVAFCHGRIFLRRESADGWIDRRWARVWCGCCRRLCRWPRVLRRFSSLFAAWMSEIRFIDPLVFWLIRVQIFDESFASTTPFDLHPPYAYGIIESTQQTLEPTHSRSRPPLATTYTCGTAGFTGCERRLLPLGILQVSNVQLPLLTDRHANKSAAALLRSQFISCPLDKEFRSLQSYVLCAVPYPDRFYFPMRDVGMKYPHAWFGTSDTASTSSGTGR